MPARHPSPQRTRPIRIQRRRVPLREGLRGPRRPRSLRRGGSPPPPPPPCLAGVALGACAIPRTGARPLPLRSPGRSRRAVGESAGIAEAGAVPAFRRSSSRRPLTVRSPRALGAPASRPAGSGRGGRTRARGVDRFAAVALARGGVAPFDVASFEGCACARAPFVGARSAAVLRRGLRSIASHSQVPMPAASPWSGFLARAAAPLDAGPSVRSRPPLRPLPGDPPLRAPAPLRASAARALPASPSSTVRRVSAGPGPIASSGRTSRRSARVDLVADGDSGIGLGATKSWSERLTYAFTCAAGPGAGGSGVPPRENGGTLALPP